MARGQEEGRPRGATACRVEAKDIGDKSTSEVHVDPDEHDKSCPNNFGFYSGCRR